MNLTDILTSNRRMSYEEIARKANISRTTLFKIRQWPESAQVGTLRAVLKAMGYNLILTLERQKQPMKDKKREAHRLVSGIMNITKIPHLEAVDPKHRVLNIGTYNVFVSSCGICNSDETIEPFGKHCLGFGSPSQRAGNIDKTLAVVYECPACHERQWSHSTVSGGYYVYLRFLHRAE